MRLTSAVILLVSLGPAQEPSSKGINFYSVAKEQEIGREFSAKLHAALPIVHEPKLDAYVAKLSVALAQYANSPFAYTFHIYEDRRPGEVLRHSGPAMPVDAFQDGAGEPLAVAGGAIFVPMSLLAGAPSEAVLAFQLAHAMAHIASRHGTRLATKVELMQISTETAQNVNVSDRHAQAMQMGTLTFARAAEREADYLAVQIVSKAGYSPEAMAAWLSGQPAPQERAAFSAHIAPSERAKAIRAEIEKILPDAIYVASTGGFSEAKALAAAVR